MVRVLIIAGIFLAFQASAQREQIRLDDGWRFALGHATNAQKDFNHATGAFSYYAKAGFGDGPAAGNFDDRSWRILDLPHDWAVELPFDARGSHSHGYRAIGRNFPENSIGWYRKTFFIPATDRGRRIVVRFDGVFRDSKVWINGFYLGNEQGGYNGFSYDITDYLKYGGTNTISVRADATMEEGWFYEGAGIYRHVWLTKTAGLHVAGQGVSVQSRIDGMAADGLSAQNADVTAVVSLSNEQRHSDTVSIRQTVLDSAGKIVATEHMERLVLGSGDKRDVPVLLRVYGPRLWSITQPYLYKLKTIVAHGAAPIDSCITSFGCRTIRWDADSGFFLNGRRVELKGTNEHQDHAGVGVAVPDELWEYRICRLKELGSNAYRCSHNPPAPELLDACDRLGMLVIDENRWMGVTPQMTDPLRRMILRDRNHPSIIAWSIGNEEWAMEGTPTGAAVAATLQEFVRTLDTTRPVTAAVSGGWGNGISSVIQLMGYNYIAHGSTDDQHRRFPEQPGVGTEEGQMTTTRGVYVDDPAAHRIAAYDRPPLPGFYNLEDGWKHYAARPYLAGMFIWTGFDYRGEPSPFGWPSVASYTGVLDACGFPKDIAWYFRSWWTSQPTLHLFPHWNWAGKQGQPIAVWAYSNCEAVELLLNGKSLGKKPAPANGHLEWTVPYQPGVLEAVGYRQGRKIISDEVHTTGAASRIVLQPETDLSTGHIAVVTIKALDAAGRPMPVADNEITFQLQGPAKIIGVGNGDPVSHEADQYTEKILSIPVSDIRRTQENGNPLDDADTTVTSILSTGNIPLQDIPDSGTFRLFFKSIGTQQTIRLNGQLIGRPDDASLRSEFAVDRRILHPGNNVLSIVAKPFRKKYLWDELNHDPGVLQVVVPAGQWTRRLFNGLAQVIIQSTGGSGSVTLSATSPGIAPARVALSHQVSLPKVFGDNMVLQRNIPIPVWGQASPGATVIGKLADRVVAATADQQGKWMLHFPKLSAGGPYTLSVTEKERPESRVEFRNILVGDVWLASGQSNMEFQVQQAKNAASELDNAAYPDIRLLNVDHAIKLTPQTDISAAGWKLADSASVKQFSAVAFFFARKIHAEHHVPIGIIQTTWGGTPIQAWTSKEKLLSSPITRSAALANDTLDEHQFLQDSLNIGAFWDGIYRPKDNSDKRVPMPEYDDAHWAKVDMPRLIKDFGIGPYQGIMWLRKKVVLPADFSGKSLSVDLGHPEMTYSLYFNGVEICKNVWNAAPRHTYTIPAAILRKGENTVSIRMAMLWGGGGLNAPAEDLYVTDGADKISLAGEWRYNKDIEQLPTIHNYQYYPDVLFNAMINPLVPYGITGFLWYQGEANDAEAYNYRKMFPSLIADWRERWRQGDLPFLFVQLANFKSRKPLPAESEWAELREAQAMALSQRQTAMACAIDIGEGDNIHPTDKQDVGLRLALGAEKLVYRQSVIASGPTYKHYTIQGNRIRIHFVNTGSGLTGKEGKPVTGFAIAGSDRQFHWAEATVHGDDMIIHSGQVAAPKAVRYAWADNPECNLVNSAGLPAVPFRTDDWPGITEPRAVAQPITLPIMSPNHAITATVELDTRGALYYRIDAVSKSAAIRAIPRSALGFLTNEADFSRGLTYAGLVSQRKIAEQYRLIHGKRRDCKNEATENTFRFKGANGRLFDLVFRAYDDGVAFRYELPHESGESCLVTGERTAFVIPEGTERWMQQYTSPYEALYPAATTGKADAPDHQQWGFPALYKVQHDPLWVLITEADVSRANCASRLSNFAADSVYKVTMPENAIPAGPGWRSAWRVLMIGSLADIVQSTLVTDLSEPSRIDTTNWINPGPVAWVYWAYNHGSKDYKRIVEYVNLAKTMHWPYVLIDWEWDRMTNGGTIGDAVAYARSQGIKPLMWYNSRDSLNSSVGLDPFGRLSTHEARCREFAWLNSIGVAGVKVDFFEDDRQKEMAYYLDLLEDAARYHLMVDFHGATIPKGWERTYPNLMTMEAVYGAEWYGYAPILTQHGAEHNATLPFTRNVVGAMDYTPVTFTDIGFHHTTTYGHELALSVVFESGLQHFADRPEGFAALPAAARQFLMTVPVAWDEIRLVDGFPGKRVVLARRKERTWYLGGLNGEDQPQNLRLSFDFLPPGAYELALIRDGATAKEFSTQTIIVKRGTKAEVNCLPRGGFVGTLTPAHQTIKD